MRKKIGECLIQAGLITEEDLQIALAEHKRTGERVGAVLVRLSFATEKQITKALAYQLGFPYTSLVDEPPDPVMPEQPDLGAAFTRRLPDPAAIILIPKDVALKRVCVPVKLERLRLVELTFTTVSRVPVANVHPKLVDEAVVVKRFVPVAFVNRRFVVVALVNCADVIIY